MSEQKLIDLGAECVGGDLILSHKTVGLYRDGAFRMTDDGRDLLQKRLDDAAAPQPVLPEAEAPVAAKPAPAPRAPRKPKTEAAAPAEAPAEAPADSTADLLKDLDATLGE